MKEIGFSIAYTIIGTVLMASGVQLIANAVVGATSDQERPSSDKK